ncbi:MAG: DEAD/DEAH box helicase [Candidatus Zixiibacteriota bacterium]|nr:MAG: DEAD/DEAH box helicase [candidate division Zixibacteria bacterium]
MQLSELEKWGIPPLIIEQWRQRQGDTLLPAQSRAIKKGLLGDLAGDNLQPVRMIVSAPTSSGKSFCAEMAAARALTARRKTVMLFPLKSLAEQHYRLLSAAYEPLGVECLIVTGDHPENNRPFMAGDFQIAVAIYEKFDLLLTASLDALKNIGLVVVDEIQTISEPLRGAVLERLLTKTLASVYNPSLLALSAVIGDDGASAGVLARWLDATLVEERVRPVELMRGVAAEGCFRYRLFNGGTDGSEPFDSPAADGDLFGAFVDRVKNTSGSTLVFLKSRQETVEAAFRLAASVGWPPAKSALAELAREEPSFLIRSLRQALARGVAFHNSDLTLPQRKVVEQAFINQEITVLFSTTTLAMGVNLSADTVYLETVKYTSGQYHDRPSLVPVSRAEFDNMTGRAGRLSPPAAGGAASPPGRAVVMAENEFDRDVLWHNYIDVDTSRPLRSAFLSMPLADWLLDMIVARLICDGSEASLLRPFQRTFHLVTDGCEMSGRLNTALRFLKREGLVNIDAVSSSVTATAAGRAAALSGLSVAQAVHYRHALAAGYPQTSAGWMALALSAPGWSLPPSILSRTEQAQNTVLKTLHRSFDHLIDEAGYILGRDVIRGPLPYRQAASLKALLLLEQWRRLVPVEKLEQQFQLHLGQILSLGETASHLVSALGELVAVAGEETSCPAKVRRVAFTLRFGLPVEFKAIHEQFGSILTRADFARLSQAGINSLTALLEATPEQIRVVSCHDDKSLLINKKIESLRKELDMHIKTETVGCGRAGVPAALFTKPESIEIDGTYERERYLVRINGFPVRLTGKSFKYFAKLAWSRLNRDSGWIYKEDIEVGFNQARYLYRMKGEITGSLNLSWPVVENNRLGYYRLNAEPSRITINVENLRRHPDYEVRSLVTGQASQAVN